MRSFFARVAAIIASMSRFVWKTITVAGKAISTLVAGPPIPVPTPAIAEEGERDNIDRIKLLAAIIVSGRAPTADEMEGISPLVSEWLRQLDRRELSVVAMSPKLRLEDHLAGRIAMSGVPPFNRRSANPLKSSHVDTEPLKAKRKTLRQALEGYGRPPTKA